MKVRAIILAGGAGTRLGVLTAKRTKPAVPYGGQYRIIDFPLSNCINSNIFDIMILAQYRPHSLLDHIGSGSPWDLDRGFSGGVKIFTPFKATTSGWFKGTADAVQQNFSFIKRDNPDLILILSGDHVYKMNFGNMIDFHLKNNAQLTIATRQVPQNEASRFGIIEVDEVNRLSAFMEKPASPNSSLANMGIYLFNRQILDKILWEDHLNTESSHDFGSDIIPKLIFDNVRCFAYQFKDYWVDIGTIQSYWKSHMDLLHCPSPIDLFERDWIIHTRDENHPPSKIHQKTKIENCLISNGCIIHENVTLINSVLSPGVRIEAGSFIKDSIILNNTVIQKNTKIFQTIIDKNVQVGNNALIGNLEERGLRLSMIGKNSIIPDKLVIEPHCSIGSDVVISDYPDRVIKEGHFIQTRRLPNEI